MCGYLVFRFHVVLFFVVVVVYCTIVVFTTIIFSRRRVHKITIYFMLISGTSITCVGFGRSPYVAYCWFEAVAAMMGIREIVVVGPAIVLVSKPFCGVGIVWVESLLVFLLVSTLTRVMQRLIWRILPSTILLWATSVSAL